MATVEFEFERRCAAIEAYEDRVQAFVDGTLDLDRIRADAAAIATQTDAVGDRPLAGALLGVKDIVNVDGFPTRCGSALPPERLGGPEASCVTALRQAGAVIAGKTVTTEFAVSDPGTTRNPRNLAHTPGGSSSGSAAGVAAGFFDLAIGSQTAGSVIRPAGYCGVVGYKPSFGRIARDGVFPYSASMDHVGLFASDTALVEKAMTVIGKDWGMGQPVTQDVPTIGIPEGPYLDITCSAAIKHFRGVVATLDDAGFRTSHVRVLDDIDQQNDALDLLTYAELYRAHAGLYSEFREVYQHLMREGLEIGKSVSDKALDELKSGARVKQFEMQRIMREQGIDVWIAPTAPDVAPEGLASTGDYRMNSIWTYTGLPIVSIPTGVNENNLPYGMQIIGRYRRDESLLPVARDIQNHINLPRLKNFWER